MCFSLLASSTRSTLFNTTTILLQVISPITKHYIEENGGGGRGYGGVCVSVCVYVCVCCVCVHMHAHTYTHTHTHTHTHTQRERQNKHNTPPQFESEFPWSHPQLAS